LPAPFAARSPVEVDGEAGLAVVAVLEAAVKSVAEGGPVEVARF